MKLQIWLLLSRLIFVGIVVGVTAWLLDSTFGSLAMHFETLASRGKF